MNLRLDSKSMRVRVSLEEAKTLSGCGRIQEALSFPNESLLLELCETNQDKLSCSAERAQTITLNVPRVALRKLLLGIEEKRTSSKRELEVRETVFRDSMPIELRFEIDCLTTRERKEEISHG